MDLIIVESPTKARTIQKFLGKKYHVLSSFGHVRDLPKGNLGIDIAHNFEPKYVVPLLARKKIAPIKKLLKSVDKVIMATDEDREGEAIAWHLIKALGLDETEKIDRIAFHEITKGAIEDALKSPREIDLDLVDAQQARRILDRLVGYKLSPFLWQKVAKGLSAGRVQSVAVRLIVEREREIKNFKPQEYWSIEARLKQAETRAEFSAGLAAKNGQPVDRLDIKSKKEAEKILKDLEGAKYRVDKIAKNEVKRNPLPPFTTSTLQQAAWQKLRFSAKMTMSLAQNLYESGLITYHRTDSLNLAQSALADAKKFIIERYGQNYWAGYLRRYKTRSKNAQEAHEAIRPTNPYLAAKDITAELKNSKMSAGPLIKLYELIWQRFVASQMSRAIFDSTAVDIAAANYGFRANGTAIKFDGFLKVYPVRYEEMTLPALKEKEILELLELIHAQHFTQPPARYSEATLVKKLEAEGIGRPSTYAPIISTIQERNYVQKDENKKFFPTDIGFTVNDILTEHFPEIVDIKFTARLEEELDEIADGQKQWQPVIKEFYDPFSAHLEQKYEEVAKQKPAAEPTDKICPKCGQPLVIRTSRFGKFYACSDFPKCRYTENLALPKLGLACPKCLEGDVVAKKTKRGKIFYACSRWPKCDFALWDKPVGQKCPQCDSPLVQTAKEKIKCSNKECDYKA